MEVFKMTRLIYRTKSPKYIHRFNMWQLSDACQVSLYLHLECSQKVGVITLKLAFALLNTYAALTFYFCFYTSVIFMCF